MEHQDGAVALGGGIEDGGGIDPQPAFIQVRQLQVVVKNLAVHLHPFHERRQFMQPEGLHDGFPAQLGLDPEEVFEGPVGQVNPVVPVQQQQPLDHGIEQHLLLRVRIRHGLLLPALQILQIQQLFLLELAPLFAPPEMLGDQDGDQQDGHGPPHHSMKR